MKKKQKNLKQYLNKGISTPIGILVVLLVAVIAGVLIWQFSPGEEVPSPPPTVTPDESTPTPTPSPTPAPPADETADWEVYRNEEYGFEVKYPEDAFTEVDVEVYLSPGDPPSYQSKYKGIKLIATERALKLGKKECRYDYVEPDAPLLEICNAESEGGIAFIPVDKPLREVRPVGETKEISIAGEKGLFYSQYGESGVIEFAVGQDYYFIPLNDNQTLVIYRLYKLPPGFPEKDLTNQILSTFKFID